MAKQKKYREQADYPEANDPFEGVIACDPSEDRCRQEWGPDVHMGTILARNPVVRPPQAYGEQDMNPDLTLAMDLNRRATVIYQGLPQALRDKYPTWRQFWNALLRGEVQVEDQAPTPPDVSSGGGGASASEARQEGQ